MSMLVKMSWNPSERQLRQFGLCATIAGPLLGWIVMGRTAPSTWEPSQALALAAFAMLGLLGGLLGAFRPSSLKLVFIAVTLLTIPIGMVLGELMLLIVYFGIFTPVAALFRLIGRDALHRRFEPAASSYWAPKARAANAREYFRQS
jgi:hypothetical protein